ncbi:unnamed protein product [Calypogeia fissa]
MYLFRYTNRREPAACPGFVCAKERGPGFVCAKERTQRHAEKASKEEDEEQEAMLPLRSSFPLLLLLNNSNMDVKCTGLRVVYILRSSHVYKKTTHRDATVPQRYFPSARQRMTDDVIGLAAHRIGISSENNGTNAPFARSAHSPLPR